jgi:hypothetical protein
VLGLALLALAAAAFTAAAASRRIRPSLIVLGMLLTACVPLLTAS